MIEPAKFWNTRLLLWMEIHLIHFAVMRNPVICFHVKKNKATGKFPPQIRYMHLCTEFQVRHELAQTTTKGLWTLQTYKLALR